MKQVKTICPNCKRTLRNANAWHYCKEVSIDDLFVNKSEDIVLAFDKILLQVADWEEVDISATKNCVVFVRNKTFLVIKPMQKCLEAKFYSPTPLEDGDLHKCRVWNSKYELTARFQDAEAILPKFFQYLKASYLIS